MYYIFLQALGSPDSELGASLRLYLVADRNNNVKIIEIGGFGGEFGISEFSHN